MFDFSQTKSIFLKCHIKDIGPTDTVPVRLTDLDNVILTQLWIRIRMSFIARYVYCLHIRGVCFRDRIYCSVEVFTEDPRPEDPRTRGPEDPGPDQVRVYILNGQPGPGRVPIYYFGSRVCLTLCVIPESIGEHRTCQWSVSVGTLRVFCNLQLVKLGWEKYERE